MSERAESTEDSRYHQAPCGLMSTSIDGAILGMNSTLREWLGLAPDDVANRTFSSLLTASGQLFYDTRYLPVLRLRGAVSEVALTFARSDGSELPVFVSARWVTAAGESSSDVHVAVFDARERRDYERELLAARRAAESSAARVQVLQEAGVAIGDARTAAETGGALVDAVRRAFDATAVSVSSLGTTGVEPLAGERRVDGWLAAESAALDTGALEVAHVADERDPSTAVALRRGRGETVVVAPLVGDAETLGITTICFGRRRDWSDQDGELLQALGRLAVNALDRIALHEQLRHGATHDQLTGLANRRLLADAVDEVARRSRDAHEPFAVIVVDLNAFKQVNDRHGHLAGDAVLQAAAVRLRAVVRDHDVVARIGGDEFVIVCGGVDLAGAELIAERAQRALAESVEAAPGVELGASVGVALCAPNDTRTTAELFRDADAAMYRAKTRATGRPGRTS